MTVEQSLRSRTTPREVMRILARIRERALGSTKDVIAGLEAYVAELVDAARRLELIHPQAVYDLYDILDTLFMQRFGAEWSFGKVLDEPLEKVIDRAVESLWTRVEKEKREMGVAASEASVRNETKTEVLALLARALETLLVKYVFPPA